MKNQRFPVMIVFLVGLGLAACEVTPIGSNDPNVSGVQARATLDFVQAVQTSTAQSHMSTSRFLGRSRKKGEGVGGGMGTARLAETGSESPECPLYHAKIPGIVVKLSRQSNCVKPVKLISKEKMFMQTIIAILNQKGGVGKTTTAVTLASGLARMKYRVLLADLDTQGNVADCLGLASGDDLRRLLSPDLHCEIKQAIVPSALEHLDVIRSDKSTTALKQTLAGVTLREYILADVFDCAGYDVVVLDCAPSVDLLHFAALVAADYLLIPTRLDKLALNGVRDALQTLAALKRISHCQVAGILPTFYERVTLESHEQLIHLAQTFGRLVLPPIPQDTQCRVASRYGKTLWEHEPNAKALVGYEYRNKQVGGYFAGFRKGKGTAMKSETQKGLTLFENLPSVDPAVESLLGQGQRRQAESHLPRNEQSQKRKERERAQKRLPHRINLDLPQDLKTQLERLAKKEGVPVSQLVAFLLYSPVHQLENRAISLFGYKTASGCRKFDWNIDLNRRAVEVLRNDEMTTR